MKALLTAAAAAVILAGAGPASAQLFQSLRPAPPPPGYQSLDVPSAPPATGQPQGAVPPPVLPAQTSSAAGVPSWMQNDGSSSDYPIHNPGDRSGDALNTQYQGGLYSAPGTGLPAR